MYSIPRHICYKIKTNMGRKDHKTFFRIQNNELSGHVKVSKCPFLSQSSSFTSSSSSRTYRCQASVTEAKQLQIQTPERKEVFSQYILFVIEKMIDWITLTWHVEFLGDEFVLMLSRAGSMRRSKQEFIFYARRDQRGFFWRKMVRIAN